MTTTGVTMNTTTGTVATAARAGLVLFVGTAPDARPSGGARGIRPRPAHAAVAPYPHRGAPAVTAPLSA
ncbi:hypothetical protein [Curtobacterium sp. SORGH_AS_0776]|uniref:hypothetical protein n=1 Tax=Curtobacterium sp. SORGH_AS_0776 TaxID=3041798 RepID=UPI00286CD938|nr:hypothetical protein [Curtobacterium sp. SORGH_AS_0776]